MDGPEGGIGMKSREGELREYNRAPDGPKWTAQGERGGVESQRVGRSDNSGPEDKWRVINENNYTCSGCWLVYETVWCE